MVGKIKFLPTALKGDDLMRFRKKLKRKRILGKYVQSIKLMFRNTFYLHIYKSIINDFAYNHKTCIRYYKNMGQTNDESIELELLKYHNENFSYNEDMLHEIFLFTATYIKYKTQIFNDIYFTMGEDKYGSYFEIGYKDSY